VGIIVAIDGPAGAGKGTLGRAMACELDLAYLDTGLLYRAVARKVMESLTSPFDQAACWSCALSLVPEDMERADLRSEDVAQTASIIAAMPSVRTALVDFQRGFAESPPDGKAGAVLDGRDIGTVICPDANLKLFLTADLTCRTLRRYSAALQSGEDISPHAMAHSIRERDEREASRQSAPMRPAHDAVVIDTTLLTAEEVLEKAIGLLAGCLNTRAVGR
jgi:cytidylate kinase